MQEYEYEPVPGLPGHLPSGEVLLWQGAPRWRSLMRFAFNERFLVVYFVALLGWYAVSTVMHGSLLDALAGTAWFAGLAILAVGILEFYAWIIARTTRYSITNKRVVMRFGVALPMTVNLPFKVVENAGLRINADGSGDLVLTMLPDQNVSYAMQWPHVRPWHFLRAKPMLRSVADAERVGSVLGRALALAHGQSAGMVSQQNGARTSASDSRVPA